MELVLHSLPPRSSDDDVEIVEHKGIGHPDTMCDALAEAFAVALARHYRERFGEVLHFNVDKALLVGGAARPAYGGGELVTPLRMLYAGRATCEVGGTRVPIDEIAFESGKNWIRRHLHALDPDRDVEWRCLVRGGSRDLVGLFRAGSDGARAAFANDTSIGAGYAPLSLLERTVLAAAQRLQDLARERPWVGEDVKIMGVRRGPRFELTVACALVGRHLESIADYSVRRGEIENEIGRAAERVAGRQVDVVVNAADDIAAGRAYVTVTGTSAEAGDDGQVGRGNRVNGLITPCRPMSLEAAAGKNPLTHVGKLYNVAAHRIASSVVDAVPAILEAECVLVSRIGAPVDRPPLVEIRARTESGELSPPMRSTVAEVARTELARIRRLTEEILDGSVRLY